MQTVLVPRRRQIRPTVQVLTSTLSPISYFSDFPLVTRRRVATMFITSKQVSFSLLVSISPLTFKDKNACSLGCCTTIRWYSTCTLALEKCGIYLASLEAPTNDHAMHMKERLPRSNCVENMPISNPWEYSKSQESYGTSNRYHHVDRFRPTE